MEEYSVIEEFKKKKRRQVFVALLFAPVLLLKVFSAEVEKLPFYNETVFVVVLSITVFGAIGFSILNWRCPNCGKYLGKEVHINHCKKCGVQLVEYVD